MGKVFTHMTMSLDGFVADPHDQVGELFDWYEAGEVTLPNPNETVSFQVDDASAQALRELTGNCGALVAGRRLFDIAHGWGDKHPAGAPVVVVTHRAPEDAATQWPTTTFGRGSRSRDHPGQRDRRRSGRHYRERDDHPAGTRSRSGGRGMRQPRSGAVRREDLLLHEAGAGPPTPRRPDRRPGTPCPSPAVPGPTSASRCRERCWPRGDQMRAECRC